LFHQGEMAASMNTWLVLALVVASASASSIPSFVGFHGTYCYTNGGMSTGYFVTFAPTTATVVKYGNTGSKCDIGTATYFTSAFLPFTYTKSANDVYTLTLSASTVPSPFRTSSATQAASLTTSCGKTVSANSWTYITAPSTCSDVLGFLSSSTFELEVTGNMFSVAVNDPSGVLLPVANQKVQFAYTLYSPTDGYWTLDSCQSYGTLGSTSLYYTRSIGLDGAFEDESAVVTQFFTDAACQTPYMSVSYYGASSYVGTSSTGAYAFFMFPELRLINPTAAAATNLKNTCGITVSAGSFSTLSDSDSCPNDPLVASAFPLFIFQQGWNGFAVSPGTFSSEASLTSAVVQYNPVRTINFFAWIAGSVVAGIFITLLLTAIIGIIVCLVRRSKKGRRSSTRYAQESSTYVSVP